jgi:hypothetical protein
LKEVFSGMRFMAFSIRGKLIWFDKTVSYKGHTPLFVSSSSGPLVNSGKLAGVLECRMLSSCGEN